jgi:hypothetical protein
MNSIAAYQMVKAIDDERHASAARRREAMSRHAGSAEVGGKLVGGQSWRAILRFPRFTPAALKG